MAVVDAPPSARTDARVLAKAEGLGCVGPRVFDLAVALTVHEHEATAIWTHDRRFVGAAGLASVDPLLMSVGRGPGVKLKPPGA